MRVSHQSMTHVAWFDPFVEIIRLLFQGHRKPFDQRDFAACSNPNFSRREVRVDPDILYLVIGEIALACEILPSIPGMRCLGIESSCALVASEPHRPVWFTGKN